MKKEKELAFTQSSTLTIDIKSLIGILAMILSIAGVYFSLTGKILALQLDVIRMQDSVATNEEFRIKWPRGDLNIQYLQKELSKIQEEFDDHIEDPHAKAQQ